MRSTLAERIKDYLVSAESDERAEDPSDPETEWRFQTCPDCGKSYVGADLTTCPECDTELRARN